MKKYLVLVDGLFALLGSAINFFGPILILAMGIGAYKDTFRYFIALNIWNVFIFLVKGERQSRKSQGIPLQPIENRNKQQIIDCQ